MNPDPQLKLFPPFRALGADRGGDLMLTIGATPLLAAAGIGSNEIDTRGRFKTSQQAVDSMLLLLAAGADINARVHQETATLLQQLAASGPPTAQQQK